MPKEKINLEFIKNENSGIAARGSGLEKFRI